MFVPERRYSLDEKLTGLGRSTVSNVTHFQPFEVVDRGSETQPQVVENYRSSFLV